MSGLWCLGSKGWGRAALPTACSATTTSPTLARRRTGRKFPLPSGTDSAQKPKWPRSGFFQDKFGSDQKNHETFYSTGNFLGKTNSPNITVVDTPGFKVNFYKFSAKVFFQPEYFHFHLFQTEIFSSFSNLNIFRTSATQSLWRSWWMFLETRFEDLKTQICKYSNSGQRDRELCNCLQIQRPVYQPLCKDTEGDHQDVWWDF